jgi:hypothetical protein
VRCVALVLVVLACAFGASGCGSHQKASTPPTVAGRTEATQNFLTPSFKAAASAQATEISAFVVDLQRHLAQHVQVSGGLLKTNCTGGVETAVSQRASSGQEKQVARTLLAACQDLNRAITAAEGGKTAKAKQLASQALTQAKLAASASR